MNTFALIKDFLLMRSHSHKSRKAMLALQEKKLRKLLRYAYDHSPYYQQSFQASGIHEDQLANLSLREFPTLDKQTLMAHFDELITVSDVSQEALRQFDSEENKQKKAYLDRYHIVHSSGSTGAPSYFLYDKAAWHSMLLGILRGALWGMSLLKIAKLLLGRPRILYIAATDGRYGGAMAVGDGIEGVGAHQLFLDINTPIHEWKQRIDAFKPNMVIGYPSAIQILADMAENGDVTLKLLRVVSCGEPLSPGMRSHLQTTLQTEVVNFYGAGESLALGVEGANETDMTLFDDLNVIEVIGGKMYLTCLYNYAQPLIRYHISDCLTLKQCTQDAFTHAELLLSRNEDMLWFENEQGHRDFLHPLAVEGFCVSGLRDYQFVQSSASSFTMLAVASPKNHASIKEEMTRRMASILKEKHLEWVLFELQFVSDILPDCNTGKKRLILQAA